MFDMLAHVPKVINAGDPLADRYPGKETILHECAQTGCRIVHRRPGYYVAGSALTLQPYDVWGAVSFPRGVRHGQFFKTHGEARDKFDRVRAFYLELNAKRAA